MKFKKIVLTILSVTLMVSILATGASAVTYFGASSTGGYSGIALLEPSYASCKASTRFNSTFTGGNLSKQTVMMRVQFVNEPVIERMDTAFSTRTVEVTAISVLGSGRSWAESIHTQTIGGTTYRKDLSA